MSKKDKFKLFDVIHKEECSRCYGGCWTGYSMVCINAQRKKAGLKKLLSEKEIKEFMVLLIRAEIKRRDR